MCILTGYNVTNEEADRIGFGFDSARRVLVLEIWAQYPKPSHKAAGNSKLLGAVGR